jgi:hypothetical protein
MHGVGTIAMCVAWADLDLLRSLPIFTALKKGLGKIALMPGRRRTPEVSRSLLSNCGLIETRCKSDANEIVVPIFVHIKLLDYWT